MADIKDATNAVARIHDVLFSAGTSFGVNGIPMARAAIARSIEICEWVLDGDESSLTDPGDRAALLGDRASASPSPRRGALS